MINCVAIKKWMSVRLKKHVSSVTRIRCVIRVTVQNKQVTWLKLNRITHVIVIKKISILMIFMSKWLEKLYLKICG